MLLFFFFLPYKVLWQPIQPPQLLHPPHRQSLAAFFPLLRKTTSPSHLYRNPRLDCVEEQVYAEKGVAASTYRLALWSAVGRVGSLIWICESKWHCAASRVGFWLLAKWQWQHFTSGLKASPLCEKTGAKTSFVLQWRGKRELWMSLQKKEL